MDPIQLELFTNRFQAIAASMGEMLRRTAVSTNVKERLDFSCALLDAEGRLVVNAPHIPVHLGAMEHCVQRVAEHMGPKPGDVFVTNHPAFGGSHLPDITVITPVFDAGDGERLLGYTASRAHHAELGGRTPGSMPPRARTLEEEGVVIAPRRLADGGTFDWDGLRALLRSGPWPSRAPEDNVADLAAAVAANRAGAEALLRLAQDEGIDRLQGAMRALQQQASEQALQVIRKLEGEPREAEQFLDDGTPLRVRIEARDGLLTFDFAGTAPVHPGNLNATPAIVHAAVIYTVRLMARDLRPELPLNGGLMERLRIVLPANSVLNPDFSREPLPAVVGGNVETSQRLVDTLLLALGLAACSQGTMNNVLFGNDRFGYYETICGGEGATPEGDGASAVHTHMTNTRITDPEVLEARYPVRLERFAVRRGSGGAGRHRGGDGVVRALRFLEPVTLSVLTQHRSEGPAGAAGGSPGAAGRQWIVRADGREEALASVDGAELAAGDRFVVETPGGGGFGAP